MTRDTAPIRFARTALLRLTHRLRHPGAATETHPYWLRADQEPRTPPPAFITLINGGCVPSRRSRS
jgi:hypothetical protein